MAKYREVSATVIRIVLHIAELSDVGARVFRVIRLQKANNLDRQLNGMFNSFWDHANCIRICTDFTNIKILL